MRPLWEARDYSKWLWISSPLFGCKTTTSPSSLAAPPQTRKNSRESNKFPPNSRVKFLGKCSCCEKRRIHNTAGKGPFPRRADMLWWEYRREQSIASTTDIHSYANDTFYLLGALYIHYYMLDKLLFFFSSLFKGNILERSNNIVSEGKKAISWESTGWSSGKAQLLQSMFPSGAKIKSAQKLFSCAFGECTAVREEFTSGSVWTLGDG